MRRDPEVEALRERITELEEQFEAALNLIHDIHEANPNGYYGQEEVEAFIAASNPAKGYELHTRTGATPTFAEDDVDYPAIGPQSGVQGVVDLGTAETGDRGPSGHPAPSPANSPHEHTLSLSENSGVYRCMTCGVETIALSPSECDGTRYCVAETHIHGCFAERVPASVPQSVDLGPDDFRHDRRQGDVFPLEVSNQESKP